MLAQRLDGRIGEFTEFLARELTAGGMWSIPMAIGRRAAILSVMSMHFTTQSVYAAAVAVAMITAGLSKRRLEWKRRPPRRKKRG